MIDFNNIRKQFINLFVNDPAFSDIRFIEEYSSTTIETPIDRTSVAVCIYEIRECPAYIQTFCPNQGLSDQGEDSLKFEITYKIEIFSPIKDKGVNCYDSLSRILANILAIGIGGKGLGLFHSREVSYSRKMGCLCLTALLRFASCQCYASPDPA